MRFWMNIICTVSVLGSMGTSGVLASEEGGLLSLPPVDQPRIVVVDREWPEQTEQAKVCFWKDDKLATFTLTIDDNHAQDHPFWLALGEATGWKWTWFIISGKVETPGHWGTWDEWRHIAALGHDVQSHSVMHLDSRQKNPLSIEREYADSQAKINEEIPNARCLTLAYPNGYKPPNDDLIAAKYYIACRGAKGHPNPIAKINYREVNSLSSAPGFLDPSHWAAFMGAIDSTNRQKFRTWYSCHFHGLNLDLKHRLNDMMDYLKSIEEEVWVGTFREAALYAQERDTAKIESLKVLSQEVSFSLTDTLENSIYDYPLTVKLRLPDGWDGAVAEQNGSAVQVSVIDYEGALYALVSAVPDQGKVVVRSATGVAVSIRKEFVAVPLKPKAVAEVLEEGEQPSVIPGPWDLKAKQPLPALEDILSREGPKGLIYGLYSWAGEYHRHRESIQKIGWKALRFAGPIDDRIMTAVVEDGVSVMVTLNTRLLDAVKGKDRMDYDSDEAFIEDYIEHVIAFLDRYGPGGSLFTEHPELPNRPLTDIEIWNEPNFHYLIPGDSRSRVEIEEARTTLYAKMLPQVYQAIKAAHPSVTVIAVAAGGMSAGDLRFIKSLHTLDPELPQSYDVLSTHPYVRPAPPEANSVQSWGSYSIPRGLDYIRNVLTQVGAGDKPIWYTELGWPISKSGGGAFETPTDKAFVTPTLQAAYTCRSYALALRLGVDRVHSMFIVDADGFNGGFFNRDGSWRIASHAVQTMIQEMPNPVLLGAVSDGVDGCYAYRFDSGQADSDEVIMAWNVAGPRTLEIEAKGLTVSVVDMWGKRSSLPVKEGKVQVPIGPCPVYISGK